MTSHLHLIIRVKENKPEIVLGRFKEYTSKKLRKAIQDNKKESRREWLLVMFKRAGLKSSNVKEFQLWQHNNHPIELWSNYFIEQKLNYIHQNPVKSGYVNKAEDWKYCSAIDYAGEKGLIEIDI